MLHFWLISLTVYFNCHDLQRLLQWKLVASRQNLPTACGLEWWNAFLHRKFSVIEAHVLLALVLILGVFSVSLINVCNRKRRSSFSFRFMLISRDITAEGAWWGWSRGSFTLGSCYRKQCSGGRWQWKEFSVPFGLLPSLVLYLWINVGRAVIYSVVGKKRPKLFYTQDRKILGCSYDIV